MNHALTDIPQSLDHRPAGRGARRNADPGLPIPLQALRWLDRRSPSWVCALGGLIILLIGLLSYFSGPQLSSSLLYLIPVIVVTRVTGFHAGFMAALLAATVWLVVDLNGGVRFEHEVTPYWNALMRLGTFVVAVGLVTAMRSLTTHLEDRVRERTAALEAEIAEKLELEKNILEISDNERATIGQDLHDGLCQQLVSAAFSCNMLHGNLRERNPDQADHVNRIADMIDDSITQARNLARGLYPVRLETEGLEMALRELASTMNRRFGISCVVDCPSPVPPCGHNAGIHLYRIAQEAVVNSAKHSRATRIQLSLSASGDEVHLSVTDDGTGISNTPSNPNGMGLRIMEYRARLIGASFAVEPISPEAGTRVECRITRNLYHS